MEWKENGGGRTTRKRQRRRDERGNKRERGMQKAHRGPPRQQHAEVHDGPDRAEAGFQLSAGVEALQLPDRAR